MASPAKRWPSSAITFIAITRSGSVTTRGALRCGGTAARGGSAAAAGAAVGAGLFSRTGGGNGFFARGHDGGPWRHRLPLAQTPAHQQHHSDNGKADDDQSKTNGFHYDCPSPHHDAAAISSASSTSTATSRDTPGSCMVTPISCCAISIVPLLWVM